MLHPEYAVIQHASSLADRLRHWFGRWFGVGEGTGLVMNDQLSAASSRRPLLQAIEITKYYGSFLANDAISVDLYPAEIHALLGENGAGKSTLVKAMYGLVQPTSGELRWLGDKVVLAGPAQARALGIGKPREIRAFNDDAARGRPGQPAQNIKQSGFAAARRPHHAHESPTLDCERHSAQRRHFHAAHAIGFGEILSLDDGGHQKLLILRSRSHGTSPHPKFRSSAVLQFRSIYDAAACCPPAAGASIITPRAPFFGPRLRTSSTRMRSKSSTGAYMPLGRKTSARVSRS